MNALALLAEVTGAGIRLTVHGDRLHVEAKPGALTAELRDRLTANKPELLVLLDGPDAIRDKLLTLAASERIGPAIVHRLPVADLAECHGLPDDTLRAYLRALAQSERMDAGQVPPGYTVVARCPECGPVWLPEPLHPAALSCPWCFRRRAGTPIPRPENNNEVLCDGI
jgi:hypothetical protein